VTFVLCLGAGGSEQLAHNEWAGSSSLFRKAFSASRKWCGMTAAGRVAAQSRVCPTAVNCAVGVPRSEICRDWGHTPICSGHGWRSSEAASPSLSSRGSSWIAGRLTKPALNPEEPIPGQRVRERGEHEEDRAPVCPYLVCVSPHTSELSYRSGGQSWPRRQGRGHGGDGTVAMLVQYMLPMSWN
jgi:hypothetical protein